MKAGTVVRIHEREPFQPVLCESSRCRKHSSMATKKSSGVDQPQSAPARKDRRGCPPGAGTVAGAGDGGGGVIGNPPYIPTAESRDKVRLYAKVMSWEMIAEALDVSLATAKRHYAKEYQEGRREAIAAVGGKLLSKALAGHPASMIFYLRTQGKWNVRVEHTGPDGGPMQHIDLSRALDGKTEEELAVIESFLGQLVATGGAGLEGDDDGGAAPGP